MEDKEKKLALQKAVGERVYHSRKLARMSKEELAERLGISSQYVNDIEQGKKCMSMAIFVELGEVFHTGLDELAHGAQKEEPVLEHLLCHLRQLSPVQRDMAVHMLHLAFRAAQSWARRSRPWRWRSGSWWWRMIRRPGC